MAQNLVEYVLDIKTKSAERGLDRLADSVDDVNDELKITQRESQKTSKSLLKMKNVGGALKKVGTVISAIGVAVLGLGAAAFSAVTKVFDLTNQLGDLSARSGVSTKTIQALRQAMLSSGQSAEGLAEVLGAISGQFAQLSTQGSAVEKKFQSFGIAVRDTNGNLRSNNDILLDSIKALQGIEDSSERSRAAVSLFGEAGAKLNQTLAAGEFEKFLQFTERFGTKIGPQATNQAALYQISIAGLETAFNGLLQELTTASNAQDLFVKGLIKLGKALVFVRTLVKEFKASDLILSVQSDIVKQIVAENKTFIDQLRQQGLQNEQIVEKLGDLYPEIPDRIKQDTKEALASALSGDDLLSSFEKAEREANAYEKQILDIAKSTKTVAGGQKDLGNQIEEVAKKTDLATEKVRTFNDVLMDLLRSFTSFDVDKFVSDFAIGFAAIDKIIKKSFDPSRIDLFANTLRKKLLDTVTLDAEAGMLDGQKFGEITIEATKFKRFEEFINKVKLGVAETFSIVVKRLGRSVSRISGALSKGLSAGAATAVTGVLAVLKIAQGLGQRGSTVAQIEKSVEQDIRARAKAIEIGLRALPRILFEVLPPLFVEFADRVVFGLFKGLAEFVRQIIDGIKSIFTREGRQERREARDRRQEARGEEFRRRLEQLVNIAGFRSGGRYLPSARGGIKFTGMQDQGLAMLHRGEFVVPETGQMPQAVQRTMGMGQGGMTININAAVVESNAVDELVRQIERRFQTFGSSTSPLFGGR